jgi:hypothetical protein
MTLAGLMSRWMRPSSCAAVDDLTQPTQQRHRARRPAAAHHRAARSSGCAAHQLHGDPQRAVGLGAERVDVGGQRVVEARRQVGPRPGSARPVRVAPVVARDLDHHLALEHGLVGDGRPRRTLPSADPLAQDEVAQRAPEQRVPRGHVRTLPGPTAGRTLPAANSARHPGRGPRRACSWRSSWASSWAGSWTIPVGVKAVVASGPHRPVPRGVFVALAGPGPAPWRRADDTAPAQRRVSRS